MKLNFGIFICFCSILSAAPVNAAVSIGSDEITTGTEIKVFGAGPDLQAIIDGITVGASERYLIKLGPGEYPLTTTLTMKAYVSIVGSGVGVTVLKGAIGNTAYANSGIVSGADNATLSDLSIENSGDSDYSSGVYNSGTSPRIQDVSVDVSGGAKGNTGFYTTGGATPEMINVTAEVSGIVTEENYALYNISSSPIMSHVVAMALGSPTNFGVYNLNSSPTMFNVEITASGGTNGTGVSNTLNSSPSMNNVRIAASGTVDSKGVFNSSGSSPTMDNVNAIASGGTLNYGVFNFDATSVLQIRNSVLSGSTYAIDWSVAAASVGSPTSRISDTQLVGGIDSDPAGTQCRNTFDEDLADVDC